MPVLAGVVMSLYMLDLTGNCKNGAYGWEWWSCIIV